MFAESKNYFHSVGATIRKGSMSVNLQKRIGLDSIVNL